MSELRNNVGGFISRTIAELRHDRRKATVLAVLTVAACVALGNVLLGSSTPARATAEIQSQADRDLASAQTPELDMFDDMLAAKGAQSRHQAYLKQAGHEIVRDLFEPNPEFFPPEQTPRESRPTVLVEESEHDAIQSHRRAILADAQALVLQSTVISSTPKAIVNGRLMTIGEKINGFELVAVTPRKCKLSKKGVIVVLKLSK